MQAVLFDMDGVLIDSEPLHYATDQELLKELDILVSDSYLDKFVGMTNPLMWSTIAKEFNKTFDIQQILKKQYDLKIKKLYENDYQPIQGITSLLTNLYQNNIPMAVASSSSAAFIQAVLKKLNITAYFKTFVSGEEIKKSKPEPDVFLKTAEMLQINPKDCIVIEDSKNGLHAAKRAGMKSVGYINKNSGNQDLSEANLIIDSFSALTFDILQKL